MQSYIYVIICNHHIYIYMHTIIVIGHQSLFHLKFSHEPQDTSLFSPQLAGWYSILWCMALNHVV